MKKNFLIEALLNAIFPPRCMLCDEIISPDRYFCKFCEKRIEAVKEKRCIGCGMPIKKCECKRFIYHFDSVVSPFYNEGKAKDAFYNFKFQNNKRAAEFFAKEMVEALYKSHGKRKFDFITYVCPSKPTDYDHCKILASMVADNLGLKLVKALKPSGKKRMIQHTLRFDMRFENVHNSYRVTIPCKNKNILLVDDIKTSGATIDECARQLKFAGAESVHCLVALVGSGEKSD